MNHRDRHTTLWLLLASIGLLILTSSIVAAQSYTVASPFQSYYASYDGMRILGHPRTNLTTVNGYAAQYFEKGRMEDHRGETSNPAWGLMYGRLTAELMQTFPSRSVSGTNLTYGDLRDKTDPQFRHDPPAHFVSGVTRVQTQNAMFVPYDSSLSRAPGYLVPAFFWDYINRPDLFPGGWLHDVGLPMSNAFVVSTIKHGEPRDVTIQAFERAVLTYDSRNPAGWTVERANIGTDMVEAQGGSAPIPQPPPPEPSATVHGWRGTIVGAQPGIQVGDYFQRDTGERYIISSDDPQIRQHLAQMRHQTIQVWGTLTPMPGSGPDAQWQGHIMVSSVQVADTGLRNLTNLATASASSTLPADIAARYAPAYAIDGQRSTAWVEGVPGNGTGEFLLLTFPQVVVVERIGLDVGYDSDASTFYDNNRVKRVAITFSSGYHIDRTFDDVWGVQYFEVAVPQQHLAETTSIKVVITDVYPGEQYDDTPIAEIEVLGKVAGR
jgi:hypothetical protein